MPRAAFRGRPTASCRTWGLRQCQAVAEALGGAAIETVYSSPLKRARRGPLPGRSVGGGGADRRPADGDQCRHLSGARLERIEARYPAEAARWRTQDPDFRIPDGESRRDVMQRAEAAFAAIREAGHREAAVVAHGGLLSAAVKVLLGIPAERNPFTLNNGSISKLAWDKDVKLLSLNQVDHLHGAKGGGGDL